MYEQSMNRYLSIGEVSSIKGISIRSLRYYDKIGVLKPAYTNPHTGYRYYTIKQFFEIDMVTVCVKLGIPLKSLIDYYQSDKKLNIKKLVSGSQRIALEKLQEIMIELQKIDNALENIQVSETYFNHEGIYERNIPERNIIFLPYEENDNITAYELALAKLFSKANDLSLSPCYQSGLMYEFKAGKVSKYIFLEVLGTSKSEMIKTLPKGVYQCSRKDYSTIKQSRDIFASVFDRREKTTVLEVDALEKIISYDRRCFELQVIK